MSLERARLIDSGIADAAWNMAVDEAILQLQPQIGLPTLRFYSWELPTISIGYFQKSATIDRETCKRHGFAFVRRPTGGRAVLHDKELTYSFVCGLDQLPASVSGSHERINRALAHGLRRLGFAPVLARKTESGRSNACFDAPSYSELTVDGKKVAGSAQTRSRLALLEHGSIPLEFNAQQLVSLFNSNGQAKPLAERLQRSAAGLNALSPRPIGLEDLKCAIRSGFEEEFGFVLEPAELSPAEHQSACKLRAKYSSQNWNLHR